MTITLNEARMRLANVPVPVKATPVRHPIFEEAEVLFNKFGLTDWRFALSNEKLALGRCYIERKKIVFSKHFLHIPSEDITDTLLHEIAHALCPPIWDGRRWDAHGEAWKVKCIEIGARPSRCQEDVAPSAKPNYRMECPECHKQWDRYKMLKRNYGANCPDCHIEVEIYDLVNNRRLY